MNMMKRAYAGMSRSDSGVAWTLPILLMLASLLGMAWLTLAPHPGEPILAVFPPWWSRTQTLQALIVADASLVGLGTGPNMVVAAGSAPGLPGRLHEAGAWLLLDARNAAGCLGMTQRHG